MRPTAKSLLKAMLTVSLMVQTLCASIMSIFGFVAIYTVVNLQIHKYVII